MKKIAMLTVAVAMAANMSAQESEAVVYDSTRVEKLQEVVVSGVRAQRNAPYAIANIRKKELKEFSKTGRELPFLFSQTPGVLAWSENGVGTGTTYMRIRGAGDSRINVTLDGVPLNSPEDQCVFWVNMNSYASLLGSVQIQRGVGTSTNGDGAFGGTVALSMATPSLVPTGELTASYGSYNTYNVGGSFSTGLFARNFVFDGAYHETSTDGFIHGTSGRSGSYYGGLRWITDQVVISYKNIGNFEKTGQAWNGVTAGSNDQSIMDGTYGEATGIKTYMDMYRRGLGRFNSLYEQFNIVGDGLYTYERFQMANGTLWDKTTDNFWQNHNILSAAATLGEHWTASATLHYTYGSGYYKEFRPDNKLSKFGLTFTDDEGNTLKRTDFVRKKGLTQNTYGALWHVNYKDESWDVIAGMAAQQFSGNHYGYLTYTANEALSQKILANGDHQYYDSDAEKSDDNVYVKAAYNITPQWSVFADMQYRHVHYQTNGINDKFYDDESGYYNQPLNINKQYDFLNPKAGFSFQQNGHRVYGSVALSHREPERNNFTDNGSYPAPVAEELTDWELGYTYNDRNWRAGLNMYYMDYTDQFVQTGMVSDIGEALTTNIKDSYRTGLEVQAAWDVTPWLTLEGNAALSINKIKDFDEFVEDWDDWEGNPDAATYHTDGDGDGLRQFHYSSSTLAFSPSTILNGFINFHWNGLQAVWHTNYVSRQYLDNTENEDRSLPGYSTSNLNLSYTLPFKKGLRDMVFGLNLNNIFAHRYAASGWVYSAIAESYGHSNDNRYYQIGFIPMTGFTAMANVTLHF